MRFFRSGYLASPFGRAAGYSVVVRSPALAATCWEFNSATLIATRAHGILLCDFRTKTTVCKSSRLSDRCG